MIFLFTHFLIQKKYKKELKEKKKKPSFNKKSTVTHIHTRLLRAIVSLLNSQMDTKEDEEKRMKERNILHSFIFE